MRGMSRVAVTAAVVMWDSNLHPPLSAPGGKSKDPGITAIWEWIRTISTVR